MKFYWVLVRYSTQPGSGANRVTIPANDPYQALQMAKALYGPLLLSECAVPV
jgi:hypothetical protein